MFAIANSHDPDFVEALISRGHRAALAAKYLSEEKYSKAVELCKEYLADHPVSLSGRLIMARALYHAGQLESAEKQFYRVLSVDPDNLVALKYLGDLMFASGDEMGAEANWRRVLQIDPYSQALHSKVKPAKKETTHTITIRRPQEASVEAGQSLKEIPFCTETVGDLYLAQGYPRLAADVYRSLSSVSENPRLNEKLLKAEEKIKQKETSNVKKTD